MLFKHQSGNAILSWILLLAAILVAALLVWFAESSAALILASLVGGLICAACGFFLGTRHSQVLRSLHNDKQVDSDILLEQLSAMTSRIGSYPSEEHILEVVASVVSKMFSDHHGAISRLTPEGDRLEIACLWTNHGQFFPLIAPEKMAPSEGSDSDQIAKLCEQAGDNSLNPTSFNLKAQGMNLGHIRLWQPESTSALSIAQHQFLETCAYQAALALANIETHRRLHRQTVRDPLTGLFNRSYLLDTLQRELHRAKRYKHSLGIVMMEVDNYSAIKDEHGPEGVNKILVAIAGIFQSTFRGHDISCRYRENTLVQILPEAALDNTLRRAEHVNNLINELEIPFRDGELPGVTLSIGISAFPEHADNIDDLIQASESAVYRANQTGGDQVMLAEKIF